MIISPGGPGGELEEGKGGRQSFVGIVINFKRMSYDRKKF